MRRLVSLTAIALAAFPGVAQADPPCLTPREFAAITEYALPSALDGAAARCQEVLPPGAFLPSRSHALALHYTPASRQAWPDAKAAFLKFGNVGGKDVSKMFATMPDTSLQPIVDGFVQGIVVAKLPLDRCVVVDHLLGLLAPLPPENTAGVIATVIGLVAEKKGGKIGPLSVCES